MDEILTSVEIALRLWADWPELPEEIVQLYRDGYLDEDPEFADFALAVKDVTYPDVDNWLTIGCEKHVMYRLVGCFCYQCSRIFEGEDYTGIYWIDSFLDNIAASEIRDWEKEMEIDDLIDHKLIKSALLESLSLLSQEQTEYFGICLHKLHNWLIEQESSGDDSYTNIAYPEDAEWAVRSLNNLGLFAIDR